MRDQPPRIEIDCKCPHKDCGETFEAFTKCDLSETTCCPSCGRQQMPHPVKKCGAMMIGKNQYGEFFSVGPCILSVGHTAHDGRPDSHADGKNCWGGE